MKKYMGLDISSTTIGFTIISADLENLKFNIDVLDYYKPPKDGTIFDRLLEVRKWISSKIDGYAVDDVIIEDISEHMAGHSTSKTIITLAVFNRTIGTEVLDKTGKNPILVNVNTARSVLRPKGYDGKLQKEDVPEVISKVIGKPFPYIYDKKGNISVVSYDMADSIAVVLANALLEIAKTDKEDKKCKSKKHTKSSELKKEPRKKKSTKLLES